MVATYDVYLAFLLLYSLSLEVFAQVELIGSHLARSVLIAQHGFAVR